MHMLCGAGLCPVYSRTCIVKITGHLTSQIPTEAWPTCDLDLHVDPDTHTSVTLEVVFEALLELDEPLGQA